MLAFFLVVRYSALLMPVAIQGVDWGAVRESVVLGVPLAEVAARHGVAVPVIKMRAMRGKWPTPKRVRRLADARAAGSIPPPDAPTVSLPPVTTDSKQGELSTEMAADSLLALGERGSLGVAKLLHGLVVRAERAPGKLAPLRDAGDLVTALKGLRSAAGLDKIDSQVQVNVALFGGGGSGSDGFNV